LNKAVVTVPAYFDDNQETADKLNNADAICYQDENMLVDFEDKLDQDAKDKIQAAVKETKEAITSKNADEATARAEDLSKVLQEVGAAMYARAQGGQAPCPVCQGSGVARLWRREKVLYEELRKHRK
jgi:molecular chaperone DnaK (HSP70)